MFALFKYTYKKLLLTLSTILFILVVALIFWLISSSSWQYMIWKTEVISRLFSGPVSGFKLFFLWFILPPFVAAKSAGFIADELEDGTFLTTISKPISRARIIISKFFALFIVNATFIFSMLCLLWWFTLRGNPTRMTSDFFLESVVTMFTIPFVLSTILSIILVILSLKIKSSLIIGLGTGIGFFSFVGPHLINGIVIKNTDLQNAIGEVVEEETYDKVNRGQTIYSKFKYLNYSQHADQIFSENIQKTLSKYNLTSLASSGINKEVLFTNYNVKEKNKLGEEILVQKYKVQALKNWIPTKTLYLMYTFITTAFLLFGFVYFNKKDIV